MDSDIVGSEQKRGGIKMEAVDKISVGVSKEKAGQNTQEAITENADGMKVSLGEKICYGVGDIGANLVWTTVASFLTIYCTDVAGIAAGIVGTLMLIARLFDGVSDLFMGIIIDKTNTRWGKPVRGYSGVRHRWSSA